MPTKPRPFPFLTVTQPSHTRTAKLTSYTMLKQRKRPITKAIYLHNYHFLTERTNQTWYIAGNKNWIMANSNQYSFKNYFYRYNWLVCLKKSTFSFSNFYKNFALNYIVLQTSTEVLIISLSAYLLTTENSYEKWQKLSKLTNYIQFYNITYKWKLTNSDGVFKQKRAENLFKQLMGHFVL